ncbi:MAG: DNA polymerase I [Candidatus Omnitrophica bacterium]|nr:DNA polymerase I [Candidatus Omnitrophota bacterium]
MSKERVFLIDATAFCYRAFYALTGLATSSGQPTNAIYGFLNILNKILRTQKPEYCAVCFDVSRETFRSKKFAQYKMQRAPTPDSLISQIPYIKEIVKAYGIPLFEKEGFEADDIIASLAERVKKSGMDVVIVSSDKDILQLVDEFTLVISPHKEEDVLYDEERVIERFGVAARNVVDIIALMGDSADNIPGVPGIGEKTAASLIGQFGSLDKLLNNLDQVKQEKIKTSLKDNLELVRLNRELAELDRKVDIDFELKDLLIGEPNTSELFRIFKHLEFKRLLKDLQPEGEEMKAVGVESVLDADLPQIIDKELELIISGESLQGLVAGSGERFFCVSEPGINLKIALEDPGIKKSGHDLKSIKRGLEQDKIYLGGLYFDTMIAAYLLNPSKSSYGFNDVAADYCGVFLGDGPVEAAKAIGLVSELRVRLEKELREKDLWKLFCELEMPLVEVLAEMESDGIKLDEAVLKDLARDIHKRLTHLINEIYQHSGMEFNINSTQQLREVLFTRLKLPVIKKGKTGPSTDEEVLRKLAEKHALPKFLLEYRQLTKLKNTYIDALPELIDKSTGKIHTSFNQTGTETGRLSSSNPNLQNIPVKTDVGKHIRRAIIASGRNRQLLSFDYSQVELRILAHLSKDENLILAFIKGRDVHKITAALIYNIAESEVTDQMREVAKRVNFGIVYGLTSYGLSRDLDIGLVEAQGFIDAYFVTYPQVKDYIDGQIELAKKQGFVTTIMGRRRYVPEISSKNMMLRQFAERQAVNTPIQGSASDLIKLAMIDIQKELKARKFRSKMILQIHDELVFDADKAELHELTALVRERMENVLKLDVPVKVDVKAGDNWLEMEPA